MFIPSCTYRVQFSHKFTFNHLSALVDYLDEMGVSGIYASPILQPFKGSEHGYDGIDTSRINPELGSVQELQSLSEKLQAKKIFWVQDIVPNHLAFHTSNVWLHDVLERGIYSSFASYFDIDWEHPAYPQKLMTPFLDAPLSHCIEQDKLQLTFDPSKGFFVAGFGNEYPINPDTYPLLLSGVFDEEEHELQSALNALVTNSRAEIDHWKKIKADFLQAIDHAGAGAAIQERVKAINNDKSRLSELLSRQHYVLCHFTVSHLQINYRRFFNVNGLICLRMEDEKVFGDYHRYVHELYQKGIIHGLRVDHVDGLKDPHQYIRRLRDLFGPECYIIVEKILDVKEELPSTWEIQGTSGYEFLSYINQVITDRKGSEKLLALYREYVPQLYDYDEVVFRNKLANLESYLNGEWDNLLRLLLALNLADDGEMRLPDLKKALGAFMACFPVYRVYIEDLPLDINDEQLVVTAFVKAFKRYPELNRELKLLRQLFIPFPEASRNTSRLQFVQRLMQFTGPLAAKGIEDTTFYQYNPLISHNEVGDQPCVLGITVREFHDKMQQRQTVNNLSFNCTSTHDTKRGEDNRIRINIISELADEWASLISQWITMNEPLRKILDNVTAPVINDQYFLYQAIVGGFPEDLQITAQFNERTKRYFTKVLREGKIMSDHIEPNIAYEEACASFIDDLLNPDHSFLPSLVPFVKKVIAYANTYTMVQVVIKTSAPGIPDIYQGCELWDLSYVDPDNRRPVDFELRKRLLQEIQERKEDCTDLLNWARKNYEVGAEKMLVTKTMLELRRAKKDLFIYGHYIPIYSEGSDRVVIAYCRKHADDWLLVVLPLGIVNNADKDLSILLPSDAPGRWRHIITGEEFNGKTFNVLHLFANFQVAVLVPA